MRERRCKREANQVKHLLDKLLQVWHKEWKKGKEKKNMHVHLHENINVANNEHQDLKKVKSGAMWYQQ